MGGRVTDVEGLLSPSVSMGDQRLSAERVGEINGNN